MKPVIKILLIESCGLFLLAASAAQAQYLDYSEPARAKALGGNLVAMPEGSSAMAFNPAGLALQERFEATARYESLFPGLENDSLSTGNISLLTPVDAFGAMGGFGVSWDHLGANLLAQDRFNLSWGKGWEAAGFASDVAIGFSLSYLAQGYTLQAPLAGVSLNQLSSGAFSFGAGLLVSFSPDLTLGLSAQDLNNPNLGVVGLNRLPALARWGLSATVLNSRSLKVTATAAQTYADPQLTTQGGMELAFPEFGVSLRGGADPYQGSVGFGYDLPDLFLDYAYSFSISGVQSVANAAPPGSHLLELGFRWGEESSKTVFGEMMKKARESESQGDWEKALSRYNDCLSLKVGDKAATEGRDRALAHYNQGRAEQWYQDARKAERTGAFLDAVEDLRLAVKLVPGNPEYSQALSEAAVASQRAQSEKDVAEAIQKTADLSNRKDPKGALQVVAAALEKHPHNAALELIQSSLQDEVDAETEDEAAAKAETAKPNAKLATTEADLFLAHGQTDLAKKKLEEALKAQPQNAIIKTKLIYLEKPTPTVSPENAQLALELYQKGLQSYLEGHLDDAIQDWEGALKADPSNTRVQNNLVRAQIEQKMEHP